MRKVWAYIDGYNLYCGLTDPRHFRIPNCNTLYRKNSWLNLESVISCFLPQNYILDRIKYFTAMVVDPIRAQRQSEYLKALKSLKTLDPPYFGDIRSSGRTHSEKKTDILIALHLYDDALNNDNYTIALVTGDTDQVPTINWIKNLNKDIEIFIINPPYRKSKELVACADRSFTIRERTAAGHQFDDTVVYEDNGKKYTVQRPALWN